MTTLHHVVLGIGLFFIHVWLASRLDLFMVRDACQDVGGACQAAHRPCSGLVDRAADLGARLPHQGWPVVLGIPALLLIGVQISLHALVTALGMSKQRSRGRPRRR